MDATRCRITHALDTYYGVMSGKATIQPDTYLWAGDDADKARAYIRNQGFTSDDVRLIRKDGDVFVIAKRHPESWRDK